jgi:hypothetical protein
VLGKAKVISYKDLKEARAKRVLKSLPKQPKGRQNVVRSERVVRPRQRETPQRETPQRRRDVAESARVLRLTRQSQGTR